MGLVTTRINLSVPEKVEYPNPVPITGTLEWFCPPFMCPPLGGWEPYSGAQVEILVDGVKKTTVSTGDDGTFSAYVYLPLGTHEVEAYYPGSWKDSPSQATSVVSVLSPEEYQSYQVQQALTYFLLGIAIPLGLYAFFRER